LTVAEPTPTDYLSSARRWGLAGIVLFSMLAYGSPFSGGATGFSFVVNGWTTVAVFGLVASIVLGRWQPWRPLFAEIVIAGAVWAVLNEISQTTNQQWIDRGVQFGSAGLVGYVTGTVVGLAVVVLRQSLLRDR
jgi:hypothetical protein